MMSELIWIKICKVDGLEEEVLLVIHLNVYSFSYINLFASQNQFWGGFELT